MGCKNYILPPIAGERLLVYHGRVNLTLNTSAEKKTGGSSVRRLWLFWLLTSGPALFAQHASTVGPFQEFMERISIKTSAGMYVGAGDYGPVGAGQLDFRVATIHPFSARHVFLTGDVSVFAGAGLGLRNKIGDLSRPLNLRSYHVGVSVPVVNVSGILGLDHPAGLQLASFYENALTRNYSTGNSNGVRGVGFTASLSWFVTEYLGFSAYASRFNGKQPGAGFVWNTTFETAGVGITFNVGRLVQDTRESKTAYAALAERHERLAESSGRVAGERDSLLRGYDRVRDSLLAAAIQFSRMAGGHANERVAGPAVVVRAFGKENRHDDYDAERLAPIRVIKIDKQLFHGRDLVEEDYLKAILSIVSKHWSYVWEIAYRDSGEHGDGEGRLLAGKVRQFFQIYDSRLQNRLVVANDNEIRTEFEIRCLGLAKQDISDASMKDGR